MAQWNKAKAARILGILRKKLYARISKYNLEWDDEGSLYGTLQMPLHSLWRRC